jgi:amino acid permease
MTDSTAATVPLHLQTYDPEQHGARGTLSRVGAAFNLAKICTGAGLLAVPYAFERGGILMASALGALIVALNLVSVRLLLACKTAMLREQKDWTPEERARNSYFDMFALVAHRSLGMPGVKIVNFMFVFTLLGASSVYMLTISTLLSDVSGASFGTCVVAVYVAMLPLCALSDLKWLKHTNALGLLCYILMYFVIFWQAPHAPPGTSSNVANAPVEDFEALFQVGTFSEQMRFVVSVFIFAINLPPLMFNVQESMAQPQTFQRTCDLTTVGVFLVYVCIGVFGDVLYRDVDGGLSPMIISNLAPALPTTIVVKTLLSVNLFFSVPCLLIPTSNLILISIYGRERVLGAPPVPPSSPMATAVKTSTGVVADLVVTAVPSNNNTKGAAPSSSSASYGALNDDDDYDSKPLSLFITRDYHHNYNQPIGKSPRNASFTDAAGDADGGERRRLLSGASSSGGKNDNDSDNDSCGGDGDGERASTMHCLAVRVVIWSVVTGVAVTVPCFTALIGFIAAVSINMLTFVLPAIFHHNIIRHDDDEAMGENGVVDDDDDESSDTELYVTRISTPQRNGRFSRIDTPAKPSKRADDPLAGFGQRPPSPTALSDLVKPARWTEGLRTAVRRVAAAGDGTAAKGTARRMVAHAVNGTFVVAGAFLMVYMLYVNIQQLVNSGAGQC